MLISVHVFSQHHRILEYIKHWKSLNYTENRYIGHQQVSRVPTLIPYHFVPLPFWERVIFCTWDIFHAIIVTNSSYRIVACKVVQRSLGKSPAKSFVQQLSLWKKYHKHNIEELVIPKRKQLFFSEQQHYSNYYYYYHIWTIQICFAPAPEKMIFFFMNKDNYVCV